MPRQGLSPSLRHISVSEDLVVLDPPTKKIHTDEDVAYWRTTLGYADYLLFLRRLNEAVLDVFLPYEVPPSEPARAILALLDTLDTWIDEIPPLPTPQRFGNLAFRTWGAKLESESESMLRTFLPAAMHPAIPHLAPYFITAFGSFVRIDYGTGHETSFTIMLCCLTLLRFFEPTPEAERELVLVVFLRYLQLCWRLQDVYRLEPAGSHGVWGLDDSHFVPYMFGSAQLRDQREHAVSAVLHKPLPPTNLYFLSIMRIHQVKHGPFHEHSSQLYAIATGVVSWTKVNSGLFKMYEAEVLGKRVVVQHIPLGGLLDWNTPADSSSVPASAPSTASTVAPSAPGATAAPWASTAPPSSSSGSTGTTAAPWATASVPGATSAPWATAGNIHASAPGTSAPWATASVPRPIAQRGPIAPARAPLGPTASTVHRPVAKEPSALDHPGSAGEGDAKNKTRPPPPPPFDPAGKP